MPILIQLNITKIGKINTVTRSSETCTHTRAFVLIFVAQLMCYKLNTNILYYSARFKEHLGIENASLGFQDHRESLRSNKSWGNQTKYEV